MDQLTDVVIVSVFGRGNWLASELAGRGWKVSLVDISDRMGPWEAEDCETPFGLFEATDLLPSQVTRLNEEGETAAAPNGLTLWLPDGPLELKSEMTAFQLEKRGVPKAVENYLRRNGPPSKESDRERKALMKLTFEENWLAHLSHQMASSVYAENHKGLHQGWAMPVFTSLQIRQVTPTGWQKGFKSCQASGVKVRAHAGIRDLRLADRLFDAVEVEDERSGVERGKSMIWMLSSGETARLPGETFGILFPRGEIDPSWYWTRYRIELTGRVFDDQIPLHTLVLEDAFLPWTHANMMVLRRRTEPKQLDIWMRIPYWARFEKEYHDRLRSEMERVLHRKFPGGEPRTMDLPVELRASAEKLGTPRFPIFEQSALNRLHTLKAQNLFFDGPEHWVTLDWLGMYRHQNVILQRLEKLKAQWDAAARREEMNENRSPSP